MKLNCIKGDESWYPEITSQFKDCTVIFTSSLKKPTLYVETVNGEAVKIDTKFVKFVVNLNLV